MNIRVLYIDLTDFKSRIQERGDLAGYFGGTGLATALFLEEVKTDRPVNDGSQPLVIAAGFLAPYFPVATKSVSMFYSPLTQNIGESHAGGRLALSMKLANIDAMVITGRSPHPVYISIKDHSVSFKNAYPLWGLKATDTATYIREKEKSAGLRSILRIGPCGERQTSYAMVVVDTYRHFGRLGMGAVFGAKNLKALLVSGSGEKTPYPADNKRYKALFEELHKKVLSGAMRKYHEYGTAMNILPLNELKGLPVRNLKSAVFESADDISGENFAEHELSRKFACAGCPLGCIHIATIRRKFAAEQEWERADISYDYELIYALGSLLGIKDRTGILSLMERVEELGLDAIYTGVLLAWITEAFEKGLINKENVKAEGLGFGNVNAYLEILNNLAREENGFYGLARSGIPALCGKYGGEDFALLAGNNAIAGYHTGYANLLGQHLIGIRNSHTDNAGYALDQEGVAMSPEEIVDRLLKEEIFRSAFNCTGLCLFVRKIYDAETISAASETLEFKLAPNKFHALGEEVYLKKMAFKVKCGFDLKNYEFPKRFFETEAGGKLLDPAIVNKAKEYFAAKIESILKERGIKS